MNEHDELSFREVRGDVPLTDDDFASIRRSVLEHIEQARPPRAASAPVWRAVAAAAVIAAVAGGSLLFRAERTVPEATAVHRPRQAAAPEPPPPVGVMRDVAPARRPAAVAAAVRPAARPPQRKSSRGPRTGRRAPEAVVASAEPITLEIHTSSPDIRIIWIGR